MGDINLWWLSERLTIIRAALLIVGVDPPDLEHSVETMDECERPPGYAMVRDAIVEGLCGIKIRGAILRLRSPYEGVPVAELPYWEGNLEPLTFDNVDVARSTVEVASLKVWAASRGFTAGSLFKKRNDIPGYLDPTNHHYSPKLAAAVTAWLALDGMEVEGMPERQALENWLTEHADEFAPRGGTKLSNTGIEEAATVANWNTKGGAPKTPKRTCVKR